MMKRTMIKYLYALAVSLVMTVSQAGAREDLSAWQLPPVPVPADNPQNAAKIALGHRLVFDPVLSRNDSISCAGCHLPFAGGGGHTPRAFGHGGELGRWAPSWVNAAYYTSQFWDGRATSLEEQTGAMKGHMGPISAPVEMAGDLDEIVRILDADPSYRQAFKTAFDSGVSRGNIAKAIAAFERTLVAMDAPFQRFVKGDQGAISDAAKRGFDIFRGKALCTTCHTPPLMTDNLFHNIGVPQVGPMQEDLGRYEVTGQASDKGAFKTPSLYNAASFKYFMHDGAFASLREVMAHYNDGGDSSLPNLDPLMRPLKLSQDEVDAIIAFIETLTDERLNRISRPAN